MESQKSDFGPEPTAVRVALWRALHIQIDEKPHVFEDPLGPQLAQEENWQSRPDMDADFSKPMRASIVRRARFIEDLLEEAVGNSHRTDGVSHLQYVILGAGLDSFAQRRQDLANRIQVFEIDQPGPQTWKQRRLQELGYSIPSWQHFVPVDFSRDESWWDRLISAGFDPDIPAFVASTGLSLYLTRDENRKMFRQLAGMVPGSVFATTFMLSLDQLDPRERSIMEFVMEKAENSGTPFRSLFAPSEIQEAAIEAGFKSADYISAEIIYERYFSNRQDGLRAGNAEAFLVAKT